MLQSDSQVRACLHDLRVELGVVRGVGLLFVRVASAVLILVLLQTRTHAAHLELPRAPRHARLLQYMTARNRPLT